MNPVFGIHVGNSRACLACYKQDDAKVSLEVIANNAGERVMPAIVTVTETENVVGTACKSLMTSHWNSTVTCIKRILNSDTPEAPLNGERKVPVVLRDGELFYEIPIAGRTLYIPPTEIANSIYHTLYEFARSVVPGEESDISCVLMVPKHFSEEARFKVRTVAESVGWDVLHMISEPAAAVLGYNLLSDRTPPPPQTVLAYRVGGTSCDATVIDLTHGMITILDTEHSDDIGGKLLISTLTKYLADEFYKRYKLDPNESHRAHMKLMLAAENCLHVLSTIESANCFVESLCEGVDFSHTMSRARFESLLFPFLSTFSRPIHSVLSRLNMAPDKINTVLLCGGLMKIPRLKKHISDIFDEFGTRIVPLPNGINYDEVLACGAALQAGCISLERMGAAFLPNEIDIPILEFPLLLQVEGAECSEPQFPAGLPLPVHKNLTLNAVTDLVVLTFTLLDSDGVNLRGEVKLEGLNDPTELKLEIDSESGIKVGIPTEPDVFSYQTVKMYAYVM